MKYEVGPFVPTVSSEKYSDLWAVGVCSFKPAKRLAPIGVAAARRGDGFDCIPFMAGSIFAITCAGLGLPTGPVSYPKVRSVPVVPDGRGGTMNSTRPAGGTLRVV